MELRAIFSAIIHFDEEAGSFSLEDIVNQLDPHFQRVLTEIGFAELAVHEEAAAEQALNCLRALEAKAIDAQYEALRRKVQEMEKAGDLAGAMRAAEELNALKRSGNAACERPRMGNSFTVISGSKGRFVLYYEESRY